MTKRFRIVVLSLLISPGCRCSKDKPLPTSEPPSSASAAPSASVTTAENDAGGLPLQIDPTKTALHAVYSEEYDGGDPFSPFQPFCGPRLHTLPTMNLASMCTDVYVLRDGTLTPATDITSEGFAVMKVQNGMHLSPMTASINEIWGRWPDGAWANVTGSYSQDGARIYGTQGGNFHYQNGSWRESKVLMYTTWSQGRSLGLDGDKIVVTDGRKNLPLPELSPSTNPDCKTRITPENLEGLPSGELFVLGTECGNKKSLAVERFAPNATKGTVDVIGSIAPGRFTGAMHAASPNRVYIVIDTVTLYRFDGSAWAIIPTPQGKPIVDATAASDGSLWVALGDPGPEEVQSVARLDPDARWFVASMLAMSELTRGWSQKAKALEFHGFAADKRDVWLALDVKDSTGTIGSVVLSTTQTKLVVPDADAGAGASDSGATTTTSDAGSASPSGPPERISDACSTPFVILYAVSKQTPANFNYPATRDALAGTPLAEIEFIEYDDGGRRTLGAKVSSRADGQKLVDRIKDKVGGSKPALVCFSPGQVLRKVSMK